MADEDKLQGIQSTLILNQEGWPMTCTEEIVEGSDDLWISV